MVIDKTKTRFKRKDYIREHLINRIQKLTKDVNSKLESHSFVFLDVPLPTAVKVKKNHYKLAYINRIGKSNPYLSEEIVPLSWESVDNKKLLLLLKKLQSNKVHIYKHIEDKAMKVRYKAKKIKVDEHI